MKRRDFIRELTDAGCVFVRHGGNHDVYRNRKNEGGRRFLGTRRLSRPELIRKQLGLEALFKGLRNPSGFLLFDAGFEYLRRGGQPSLGSLNWRLWIWNAAVSLNGFSPRQLVMAALR